MLWYDAAMYRVVLPVPPRPELQRVYERHAAILESALHELQRTIKGAVESQGLRPTLKYRIKSFDSAYEKILRRSRTLTEGDAVEITDMLGVRVICPFVEDIARAETVLRDALDVVEVERKGADLGAKEFGYASVHLLARLPAGLAERSELGEDWLYEVQLRTILQDAWAEVEHELVYKADLTPVDDQLRRKLAALNANLTLSDIIFQEIRDYSRTMQRQLMRRRETFWSQIDDVPERETVDSIDTDPINTGSDTIDSMLIAALHAHNQKDYAAAIRIYSDILAYGPIDNVAAIIHTHRGMARFALNDRVGAIEDFSATIRLSPQAVRAYYYRGVVQRHLGQLDAALTDLSRGLELDPYHVESLIARARTYRERGRNAEAQADYETARKLDPEHQAVLGMQAEIENGVSAELVRRIERM